ncbi:MAG TPA: hypothetical protein VGC71_02255 [Gaiellales bacterium]|jgi:hypothetical protein
MGWLKQTTLGDRLIEMGFSRSGRFHRHLDGGLYPDETFRMSGRHVRVVVRRRGWDDLTEEERDVRLHERA